MQITPVANGHFNVLLSGEELETFAGLVASRQDYIAEELTSLDDDPDFRQLVASLEEEQNLLVPLEAEFKKPIVEQNRLD